MGLTSLLRHRYGRVLFHHTCILKHVCPFAAGTNVAVLEVLTEVIGAVELFARVALAELVVFLKMDDAFFPVPIGDEPPILVARWAGPLELFSTVATRIRVPGSSRTVMESPLVACQRRARPAMSADMERVLMALHLIFILETIAAI